MPVFYFSDLLQRLLVESGHEWSIVLWIFQNLIFHNPAIPAKKWQKKKIVNKEFVKKWNHFWNMMRTGYKKILPLKL